MNFGWCDIEEMIREMSKWLDDNIGRDMYKYNFLGIARGGLIPAVVLSHLYKLTNFQMITVQRYDNALGEDAVKAVAKQAFDKLPYINEPYIVVDDINDRGYTLQAIKKQLPDKNNRYLVICERSTSKFKCDFAARKIEHNDWKIGRAHV